jgi:hypothetical protein
MGALKPLEDWDEEELTKRRLRNSKGSFAGRPPDVPAALLRQIDAELNRRRLKSVADLIRDSLEEATRVATEILRNEDARPADKIKVWELMLDRAFGRAVQPIIVGRTAEAEKSEWEQAVDDFVGNLDDEKLHRAREVISGNKSIRDGTSRPAGSYDYRAEYDDRLHVPQEEDEAIVREILDEEIAEEIVRGRG